MIKKLKFRKIYRMDGGEWKASTITLLEILRKIRNLDSLEVLLIESYLKKHYKVVMSCLNNVEFKLDDQIGSLLQHQLG